MIFLSAMSGKIFLLFVLIGSGILMEKFRIIHDQGLKDLSRLLVDVFWPALIFSSLITGISRETLIANSLLPLFALITGITGFLLGLIIVHINRWHGNRKAVFLYHSTINNFVFMVLPFVEYFVPGEGRGLLFVHNLGLTFLIWTLGVYTLTKEVGIKKQIKSLLSPGFVITLAVILAIVTGANRFVPAIITEAAVYLGNATMPVAMIIAGAQISKTGMKALKFDRWNIQLVLIRLIGVPLILMGLTVLISRYFTLPPELYIIFMIVNIVPVSVNAVSMAIKYDSGPELAAEGVVITHIFAVPTMLMFLWLWKDFFSQLL